MSWFQVLIFFMPAGVANATPVLANKIPLLNRWKTPVDFGASYTGKRLLGANKTWRGVLTASVLGGLTAVLLSPLVNTTQSLAHSFFIGLVLGFGAMVGDAVESFAKRQRGIASGHSWFPFDQIDYIIGGLLLVAPFAHLTLAIILQVTILFFGLHLLFAYIAYLLHLKSKPI